MADLTVSNDIDTFMQSADSAAARNSLGLGNVDNTADANKPVSTAQQSALNNKQDILTEGAFENGDKTKLDNQSGVNTGDESTATETAEGVVELATEAEVLAADETTNDAVARAKHMRVKVETGNGGALSVGDLSGDARGSGSITIQTSRSSSSQVAGTVNSIAIGDRSTASGYYADNCIAIGYSATASHYDTVAIGQQATASASSAIAIGKLATGSGYYGIAVGDNTTAGGLCIAIGYNATASTYNTIAVGRSANASANNSGAFGFRAKVDTANVQELGYWTNATTRGSAIRVHGAGYVALSTPETDTAFTDGGATAGSEADGTIMRKGLAFRVSTAGNLIVTYCKADGTIITRDLGAMS